MVLWYYFGGLAGRLLRVLWLPCLGVSLHDAGVTTPYSILRLCSLNRIGEIVAGRIGKSRCFVARTGDEKRRKMLKMI